MAIPTLGELQITTPCVFFGVWHNGWGSARADRRCPRDRLAQIQFGPELLVRCPELLQAEPPGKAVVKPTEMLTGEQVALVQLVVVEGFRGRPDQEAEVSADEPQLGGFDRIR